MAHLRKPRLRLLYGQVLQLRDKGRQHGGFAGAAETGDRHTTAIAKGAPKTALGTLAELRSAAPGLAGATGQPVFDFVECRHRSTLASLAGPYYAPPGAPVTSATDEPTLV